MIRILFVCTGNTCRSPLAEALLREMAVESDMDITVRSAGVAAAERVPISVHSATILRDKRIQAAHSSSPMTDEQIRWADLILTMTTGHKRTLLQRYPNAVDKTHTLKEFTEEDQMVLSKIADWNASYADMQTRAALGERIPVEEMNRLRELERSIPDYDIADPFGGSLEMYRHCAEEIEHELRKLLRKLRQN